MKRKVTGYAFNAMLNGVIDILADAKKEIDGCSEFAMADEKQELADIKDAIYKLQQRLYAIDGEAYD